MLCIIRCIGHGHADDALLHPGKELRIYAEPGHADSKEKRYVRRFVSHLSAYGDILSPVMRSGNDLGETPQHGWVMGAVVFGHPLVRPVHGKHVLDKVICPDREKVGCISQVINDLQHGREFHHHADHRIRVEGKIFPCKGIHAVKDHLPRLVELIEG